MTVSTTTLRADYTGNAVTTAFNIPFYFLDNSHVKVIRTVISTGVATTLAITTNYTVTGAGVSSGGTLTMLAAPTADQRISVVRNVPNTQLIHYVLNDPFPAATHEAALDQLTMEAQQATEALGRSIHVPQGETTVVELPSAVSRANNLLAFDSAGNLIVTAPVAGTATALSASLAASSGSSIVGFIQSGAGAVATTEEPKLRERISVFDFMSAAQISDVKASTFTLDCSAAINSAIVEASTLGMWLYIPAGLYKITPSTSKTDEAGTNICAFPMVSNMHIWADKGATFKISNNVSTDGAPVRMSMFFSNEFLHDISICNLTMDMNGANNKISPSRPASYNVYTQAHIIFSGTPAGVAAGGTDVLISDNKFLNTAGVTCIGMAQSNTIGITLGKRWTIRNNLFNNNGLDTNDHSSIYGYAEDVLCAGNTFTADTMFPITGNAGALVAYEVHGANTRFIGNKIKNYFQGMWVSTNQTSTVDNVIIAENNFNPVGYIGVDFYRGGVNDTALNNVIIADNTVALDDVTYATPPARKVAFQLNQPYKITNVQIINNSAVKTGTTIGSAFFSLGTQSIAAQKHSDIVVRGNHAIGFVAGVDMVTTATNGLGYVEINGNSFKDLVPAATVYTTAIGVSLSGASAVDQLNISNNSCISTSGTWQYGIYLSGSVTRLYIGPNSYVGQSVSGYTEAGFTATYRDGFFDNVSFTPTLTGWTNVGTPTFTGTYWSRQGKTVTINILIQAGTSISSTLLTSTITGLPFNPINPVVGSMAQINNGAAFNNFVVTAGGIVYPPTTGVLTSAQVGLSFTYTAA